MRLIFKMRTFVSVCLVYQYLCAAEFGSPSLVAAAERAPKEHYVPTPLTAPGSFTAGVEGPACDADGNIFAVNFAREQTIGRVTPGGRAALFVDLPGKSTGNGIRFDRQGRM